jgi:SAM-dependent methyltransferase
VPTNQAAGGYVEYDAESGRFFLTPEQAAALAIEQSPAFFPGSMQLALSALRDVPAIQERFRSGAGFGWHEHDADLFNGTERFFRPGYTANLVDNWLPALDGVVAKLSAGATVADVGCGHGASTILMAQAFENSTFLGTDYHEGSIRVARRRAAQAGVQQRTDFEALDATELENSRFDLITMFDCLHDMGDPVGAARHVREIIADDGTWMIVEPAAGDRVEDNFNPVGRAFYGFSTLLCTPSSLAQDVGLALGTQAGPARVHDVVTTAGFGRFKVAAQTPFNNVLEVKPA